MIQRVARGQIVFQELALSFEGVGIKAVLCTPLFEDGKAGRAPLAQALIAFSFAGCGIKVGFLLDIGKDAAGHSFVVFGFAGQMCDAKFDKQGNVLILSSEKKAENDVYYINLYSPTGVKYYYREFNMPVDNLSDFDGSSFYFRLNNNIVVCEKTSV